MQKEIVPFSETQSDDFEDGLSDALAQERSVIQEIEQEKEDSFIEEMIITAPHQRKSCGEIHRRKHLPDLKILHEQKKISAMCNRGGTD